MVVRFVCVIRVPVCARVSRVCPVCVPAPPGVFLPVGNYRCEADGGRIYHKAWCGWGLPRVMCVP